MEILIKITFYSLYLIMAHYHYLKKILLVVNELKILYRYKLDVVHVVQMANNVHDGKKMEKISVEHILRELHMEL